MLAAGGPVTVSIDMGGKLLARETYAGPGGHLLSRPVPREYLNSPVTRVVIRLDRTLPRTGADQRELGAVVQRLGFVGRK
jgi:hypothetical protein